MAETSSFTSAAEIQLICTPLGRGTSPRTTGKKHNKTKMRTYLVDKAQGAEGSQEEGAERLRRRAGVCCP